MSQNGGRLFAEALLTPSLLTSSFCFVTNEAGMLFDIRHFHFWNSAKAGMFMKISSLLAESRNVYEIKLVNCWYPRETVLNRLAEEGGGSYTTGNSRPTLMGDPSKAKKLCAINSFGISASVACKNLHKATVSDAICKAMIRPRATLTFTVTV